MKGKKRRQREKIMPCEKYQPIEKFTVGMYDGGGCSTRATRKNTWVCPNEKCNYTSRRFYDLEQGHSERIISLHKQSLKNSVCSLTCPKHGEKLIFLGDIYRIPKKAKRKRIIQKLKNKINE